MAKAYITDSCCGGPCNYVYDATEESPCWGDIVVVGEDSFETEDGTDWYWVHACQGHIDSYDGGEYNVPPAGFLENTPATPKYEE